MLQDSNYPLPRLAGDFHPSGSARVSKAQESSAHQSKLYQHYVEEWVLRRTVSDEGDLWVIFSNRN